MCRVYEPRRKRRSTRRSARRNFPRLLRNSARALQVKIMRMVMMIMVKMMNMKRRRKKNPARALQVSISERGQKVGEVKKFGHRSK